MIIFIYVHMNFNIRQERIKLVCIPVRLFYFITNLFVLLFVCSVTYLINNPFPLFLSIALYHIQICTCVHSLANSYDLLQFPQSRAKLRDREINYRRADRNLI